MTIITIMVSVDEVNGLPQKLFFFRSVAMSDQKKNRADAISADAFVAAYVETCDYLNTYSPARKILTDAVAFENQT